MRDNVPTCIKCKTKSNRPVVIQKKVKRLGREYVQEEQVYKTYCCACGRCEYSGDLAEKEIDHVNKYILKSSGDSHAEEEAE